MKKKTILIIVSIISVLVLSAIISIVLVQYAKKNESEGGKGNTFGISWYDETKKEFTIRNKKQLEEFQEKEKVEVPGITELLEGTNYGIVFIEMS